MWFFQQYKAQESPKHEWLYSWVAFDAEGVVLDVDHAENPRCNLLSASRLAKQLGIIRAPEEAQLEAAMDAGIVRILQGTVTTTTEYLCRLSVDHMAPRW